MGKHERAREKNPKMPVPKPVMSMKKKQVDHRPKEYPPPWKKKGEKIKIVTGERTGLKTSFRVKKIDNILAAISQQKKRGEQRGGGKGWENGAIAQKCAKNRKAFPLKVSKKKEGSGTSEEEKYLQSGGLI